MGKINLSWFESDRDDRNRKQEKRATKYKNSAVYKAMNPEYHSRKNRENREIKDKGFAISDHAIARYYERVEKVNMNELKECIVPNNIKEFICTSKNGQLPVRDKYRIVFKDKIVVTIKNR
ncbi:hypothetical protein SPONN_1506 [uncultured Candidatus Thioglobus sp.]|nr:hypothetical protein SPONN_1506 [uncultured Candidatus Thioglobus sp.]